MINTCCVDLRRSNRVKYGLRGKKAALCPGCWLVIFLSLFFIACGLMNESHTIATKETLKKWPSKEQLGPNLSPFAIVCCCSSHCVFHKLTHTFSSSWSPTILSYLYLNRCLCLCLSLAIMPHSFFPSTTIFPPILYLDTLLLASPYTGSHLCITDTLINPGFVLLQKGVGRPSGSTLIALWEHGPGLSSSFLSCSFFCRHSLFPLPSTGLPSLIPLWINVPSSSLLTLSPLTFLPIYSFPFPFLSFCLALSCGITFHFDVNYPQWTEL